MSTGRKHPWALLVMLDQLVAVADDLDPSITASHKRLWEFVSAFMVGAMGMKAPDIKRNRSRADKLLPYPRRKAHRRKMLKTEQGRVDAARGREIDKQYVELLRKLQERTLT